MRLTIIPVDKAVYVDGAAQLNLTWEGTPANVHALQWYDVTGWIEFKDGTPNEEITTLPAWTTSAIDAWTAAANPPPYVPTAMDNKNTAVMNLQDTDWATIPDVSDPAKSNPYLLNVQEFLDYRNIVRQIAINPIPGNLDWPTVPTAQWSS